VAAAAGAQPSMGVLGCRAGVAVLPAVEGGWFPAEAGGIAPSGKATGFGAGRTALKLRKRNGGCAGGRLGCPPHLQANAGARQQIEGKEPEQ
jgi:hypothetical protein